ncbi:response regulator transcription factor [Aureivirga sp. CE67]|uniref:response regulator transcription factor n=1 Tax=Aureivirga sp. CE67 TaxID=1788983 RepID=UPI0018CA81E5|nr:helix-turn-helix transcriptional regulator [Aureivirga sp. CE67]
MKRVDDFFSLKNTVGSVNEEETKQTALYLEAVKAFSRTSYKSIYVVDYLKKGFEYVSENPLFLCGYTAKEVEEMGYDFYIKSLPEEDLELLLALNTAGFDFYDKIPLEERKKYSISYDFHLRNKEGKTFLINQKLTPIFLTEDGKIWKAICIVSLSTAEKAGNIQIYKQGSKKIYKYNIEKDYWKEEETLQLTTREKEILHYSARGYTVNDIAEAIFVSPNTVKFHRKKLFDKLEVTSIGEAISYATHNKLI